MSSRWLDLSCLLLAALLEALWFGALAALLAGAALVPAVLISFAVVTAAAMLAWSARRALTDVRATAMPAGHAVLLVALELGVAAVLVVEAAPRGLGHVVAAALVSALAVGVALELGVLAGRAVVDTDRAVRRAVRSFVLVFAVVFLSFATHHPLPGAGALIALVVLAGLALVAVGRAAVTLDATGGDGSAARWAGGVVAVGALVLALALLVAVAPLGPAPAWFGALLIVASRAVLDGLSYAIAAVGYVIVRAVVELADLVHLHPHLPHVQAPSTGSFKAASGLHAHGRTSVPGFVGIVAAIALAAAGLALLLRSLRVERDIDDETAGDEREQLARPAAELRSAARRLAQRLGRLVGAGRARTPAESLRAEYRRLERSAAKAGFPREPSWTVRRYLGSLPGGAAATARLATLYEQARYAPGGGDLGVPEVAEFRETRQLVQSAMAR